MSVEPEPAFQAPDPAPDPTIQNFLAPAPQSLLETELIFLEVETKKRKKSWPCLLGNNEVKMHLEGISQIHTSRFLKKN